MFEEATAAARAHGSPNRLGMWAQAIDDAAPIAPIRLDGSRERAEPAQLARKILIEWRGALVDPHGVNFDMRVRE
jgi:hypothetical protein